MTVLLQTLTQPAPAPNLCEVLDPVRGVGISEAVNPEEAQACAEAMRTYAEALDAQGVDVHFTTEPANCPPLAIP
jgi:hypothetical protein